MNIVVLGAPGQTGRLVAEKASARGHRVTALMPETSANALPKDVRILRGSALCSARVSDAINGQDAVLLALMDTDIRSERRAMAEATLSAVRSMQRHGVRRLIALSAGLAHPGRDPNVSWLKDRLIKPLLHRELAGTLRRSEVVIRQSGLDWTLVRVSGLTNQPPRSHLRFGPGFSLSGTGAVSRADVASFMLDELERRLNIAHAVALAY